MNVRKVLFKLIRLKELTISLKVEGYFRVFSDWEGWLGWKQTNNVSLMKRRGRDREGNRQIVIGYCEDISQSITVGWQKWSQAFGVLCDEQFEINLTGNFASWWFDQLHNIAQSVSRQRKFMLRMIRLMCIELDKIRNEVIREKVGVTLVEMWETRLKWLRHMRSTDAYVREMWDD